MRQALVRLACMWLLSTVVPGVAAAAETASSKPNPPIPFETERAAARGDRSMLRLNDDASKIPAHRIKDLPIVDGRLGERVNLDGGLQVYFPFGQIVSAETRFQKYRVNAADPTRMVADPDYLQVANFDKTLGPICASAESTVSAGSRIEMRVNRQRAISLVVEEKLRNEKAPASDNRSYRVITATDIRHLRQEPAAEKLFKACNVALARKAVN